MSGKMDLFARKFQTLKEWVDDDAENLLRYAQDDDSIEGLSKEVYELYLHSDHSDTHKELGIYEIGDAEFIKLLRDFRARYEPVLEKVWARVKRRELEIFRTALPSDLVELIEQSFTLMENLEQERRGLFENYGVNRVEKDGEISKALIAARKTITDGDSFAIKRMLDFMERTGFSFGAAYAREAITPDIYLPAQISQRHYTSGKVVLYEMLRQAVNAFIFGSGLGAVALLRSIMETLLIKHYSAQGRDLSELIETAKRLPNTISRRELHELRKFGNNVLHGTTVGLAESEDEKKAFDKEVTHYIRIVKELVELVP